MVLTAVVTKHSVTKLIDNLYSVGMNLVLTDESVEVFNKDYFIRYRSGDDISEKTGQFITQMQADIDKYEVEQALYNAAAFDNAVVTVQAGLEV